jgi:predicted nucleotidyltransferase component of viral defense system
MVEQDLIICRALVSIFSDELLASQLAFRGGTALHKLYLSPQPRYFDLYCALTKREVDVQKVMLCYRKYMEFVVGKAPSYKQFVANMEGKMHDTEFLEDTKALLRPDTHFISEEAYPLIYDSFIDRMEGRRD